MSGILTGPEDLIIRPSEKNEHSHDWERTNKPFLYFMACSFLCYNSGLSLFCDSDVILRWIGITYQIWKKAFITFSSSLPRR